MSIDYAISRHALLSKVRIGSLPTVNAAKIVYQCDDPLVNNYYHVFKLRHHLFIYYMNQGIRYISGHVCFSDLAYHHFKNNYQFITVLRNPVKRWISHFFFNTAKPSGDPHKINNDIATFLKTEQAKDYGHQYVKYIGGVDPTGEYTKQQAIDRAKDNLNKFSLVGCLEDLPKFKRQFAKRFKVKLQIAKKNKGPKSSSFIQSVISPEIRKEIERLCRPDLEVYQYAIETIITPD